VATDIVSSEVRNDTQRYPERPRRSVIVCTRDRPEQLDNCLTALSRQRGSDFEVVVIDNSPSDSRARGVAAKHGVRCVEESRTGVSYARNRGAAEAQGDILAYLDDDAVPEEEWLESLCAQFDDPQVMAVVGRIIPLAPDTEGARMCGAMSILDRGLQRRVVDLDSPDWFDELRSSVGIGANMAIRRTAFAVWPGFDPRLGRGSIMHGGEEDYAFLSLIKLGYRIVYAPAAVVRHPCPATLTKLRAWHLATLAGSFGFLAFLFSEEPDCRGLLLRHLLRRLPRSRRRSFQRAPHEARQLAPIWCEALAGIKGLTMFARSVLNSKRRGASVRLPAIFRQKQTFGRDEAAILVHEPPFQKARIKCESSEPT
jgi:GT2 family glycosyltransferase